MASKFKVTENSKKIVPLMLLIVSGSIMWLFFNCLCQQWLPAIFWRKAFVAITSVSLTMDLESRKWSHLPTLGAPGLSDFSVNERLVEWAFSRLCRPDIFVTACSNVEFLNLQRMDKISGNLYWPIQSPSIRSVGFSARMAQIWRRSDGSESLRTQKLSEKRLIIQNSFEVL